MAQLRRPQPLGARVRLDARPARARSGARPACGRSASTVAASAGSSSACSASGPRSAISRLDLLADRRRHRRAQVEVGERRAQVEPGAADHDRAPALGQQRVDLGVGALGVAAGAELLAGIDEGEQPVLEPLALLRARGAAEDLQAPVDLDRVAVDRDRVLPALAQQLGERDRDAGLADGGRPEERDHLGGAAIGPAR